MMSLTASATDYVNRIVSVPGMKALLMDHETMIMVGMCSSLSHLIQHDVFLTERIDKDETPASANAVNVNAVAAETAADENLNHLVALIFIRPVKSSIDAIGRLLRSHRFRGYHLTFSAAASDDQLRLLAHYDIDEAILTVNEFYLDFYALHSHLFHCALPLTRTLHQPYAYWLAKERGLFNRMIDCILAVCLSLKRRPEIHYVGGSELCSLTATECARRMNADRELFTFNATDIPLLLLLDRRDDPITPLLLQWTYTAMVHECLTIDENRVVLHPPPQNPKSKSVANKPTRQEVVLSPEQDHFYKGSMHLNFGDLGASIKDLVADFQRKTHNHSRLDSIEAMQRFVDEYPEFKALSGTVSKHVAVVSELSRLVESRRMMEISEMEQELACSEDHFNAAQRVETMVVDNKFHFVDCVRLTMLYALRYEDNAENICAHLRQLLTARANHDRLKLSQIALIDSIIKYAGKNQRRGDLYGSSKSLFTRASKLLQSGIRGVENIYTQHKPLLAETLTELLAGRLSASLYPSPDGSNLRPSYKTIIIFMVGGCTYEESAYVEALNRGPSGVRILLGGTFVHNSASFMKDVQDTYHDTTLFDNDHAGGIASLNIATPTATKSGTGAVIK